MRKRLILLILLVMGLAVAAEAAGSKFTLVIDPGHGGHDAGALGKLTKEKNINLNVALEFGRLVERNCPDVKVIYTRTKDVFVPLHTRAEIANKNKADLFISIHTNSLPKGHTARGLETYTLGMHRAADNLDVAKRENAVILIEKDYKQRYEGFDPNSAESYIMFEFMQDHNMAQSVELAKFVQKRTCAAAGRPDKGVKQAGFLVLRETSMPSCLIELGFISTPDEERFLHSERGVERLGRGIYKAFLDYKGKYDKSGSASPREAKRALADVPAETTPKKVKLVQRDTVADVLTVKTVEPEAMPVPAAEEKPAESIRMEGAAPVFKLQIVASISKLKPTAHELKGHKEADFFQEGGMYKYTLGCSENYNEIYRLRKQVLAQFPQCFIIAFRDGEKMDVRQAIKEYKENKNNKKNK